MLVFPEALKILLQQVRPHDSQVHSQKFGRPPALFFSQILPALEKAESRLVQHRIASLLLQTTRF